MPPRAVRLLLVTLCAATCGPARLPAPPERPNVLLVTIDTFRADRVGTGVAPAIDRLAASGIRFTAARATVPLTLPSHASIHAHRPGTVATLRKLAASNPDAPVFQTTYARALKETGQLQAALAVYQQAVRRWPTDAALFHDLAVTARDAANAAPRAIGGRALREEATRADQASLALDLNSATAHNGLGLLAADEGRAAVAAKAFEQAARIDPNKASYWANLGNARRALGDRTGAEQAYRRALDVDARAADAANGVGVLLVEGNRPAEAAPWFERAIAAAPDLVEARLNLGIALQGAGDMARAADAYRLVLSARGNHPREKDAAKKLLAALGAGR